MTQKSLQLLTTAQLLEHAIMIIDELNALMKKPQFLELMEEKRNELIMVTEEIVERNKQLT